MRKYAASVRLGVERALLIALCLIPVGCATTGSSRVAPSLHGSDVRIILLEGPDLEGELLAVGRFGLWVLDAGGEIQRLPLSAIRQVRVPRHGHSGAEILRWTLVAGGLTTIAMLAACGSLEEANDCGAVGLVWGGAWALVGGISSLLIRPSEPVQLTELRAHARFPAGLPEGYGN